MDDEEVHKNKRLEKKRRLKERFDAEYDDGDATYFDDLKEEMQKQAEVDELNLTDCFQIYGFLIHPTCISVCSAEQSSV